MYINKINTGYINSFDIKQEDKKLETDNTKKQQPENKKRLSETLNDLATKGIINAALKGKNISSKINSVFSNKNAENVTTAEAADVVETPVTETVETEITEPVAEEVSDKAADVVETPITEAAESKITGPVAEEVSDKATDVVETPITETAETSEISETKAEISESEVTETNSHETFEDKLAEIIEADKTGTTETDTNETIEDELAEIMGVETPANKATETDPTEILRSLLQLPEEDIILRRAANQKADDEIEELMEEIRKETEEVLFRDCKKTEIAEEELIGISLEDFQKAQGRFIENKAYINDDEPYTGNIVFKEEKEKIVANYENGELKRTIYCLRGKGGIYDPKKIKEYDTDEDGTRIIKISNKRNILMSGYKKWFTDKIIKINDSKISILEKSFFDDYLCKYLKKQKDGTWKGFYEERKFDYSTGYSIVPIDLQTGKIMSRREYKKFFEGDNDKSFFSRLFK